MPSSNAKQMSVQRWTVIGWLALLLATPASAQLPYSGIVVFGASLSDPGNAFVIHGGTNTPPEYILDSLFVPSAPYPRGGLTLSNGAPWIVQLARPLGLAGSVRPAYRSSSPKATNYAVDRARARDDGLNVNLSDQVAQFLGDYGGVAPNDRLYVIEFGSSDVRDALATTLTGGNGSAILGAAWTSIGAHLEILYAAGARHFLIANVPNIALTPAVHILDHLYSGVGIPALATSLVVTFNAALDGIVAQLPADIDVARLDTFGKLNELVAIPAAFDLVNVTEPCVTPNDPPFTCRRPDEYLFWDGIHPTRAVHAIFAEEALLALTE